MIELKGVSYQYPVEGDRVLLALDDINLKFKEGEFVAIIGPNGSGKTTLGRLLNALLLPTSGKLWVDDLDTTDKNSQKSIRLKVGMVFQNPDNQIISTSVEREIAFGLENLALNYDEMKNRVEWALKIFHLRDLRKNPPHKLSGGEKQRVTLASVLAMKPKYLILDEPTSLLDPNGKNQINALIEQLSKEITLIHITQFPEEALFADRILVMDQGRIILDGTPLEVFENIRKFKKIGLGLPFAVELSSKLREKELKLREGILKMDDLVDELMSLKGGKSLKKIISTQQSFDFLVDLKGVKQNKSVNSSDALHIEVKDLSYVYDEEWSTEKKALDGINLEIAKGDFVGLIGPTGSGKSTLVQQLNALLFPTSGEVIIDGINLSEGSTTKNAGNDKSAGCFSGEKVDLKMIRRKVGLVFQFPELQLFEETVYDDIAFGPRNLGLSEEEVNLKVKTSLNQMGLDFEKFAYRSPFSLSGGEQRKVAIAGILALNPEVLILDEPTCGLDFQGVCQITNLLRKLNSDGITMILISHDMDLIAQVCGKIILLDEGKLVFYGEKNKFFESPQMLSSWQLKLPQTSLFLSELAQRGFKIDLHIYTLNDVVSELIRFF
jgi:energy-coupling factor transport system ATP-binding protein